MNAMKNTCRLLVLLLLFGTVFQSCDDLDDNAVPSDIAVNNFIWKGLNLYYLWQADVPDLADNRFPDQKALNSFLQSNSNSEDFFQHLLYMPKSLVSNPVDRFSVLFDDYVELEGILAGTTKNSGADYGFYLKTSTGTDVFGIVRYVLPNSDAEAKGVKRGDIFYAIDGVSLNTDNFSELLDKESYTLNLADFNSGNITPNGNSVTLTKTVLSENPVYINKVITSGSHKIGYLMYNGFYPNYETAMNNAFGELKAQGITDFILDLRYNSGGSVETATHLASMITGQFNGQLFAREQWNAKAMAYYNSNNPETLLNKFGTTINTGAAINSLNSTKIYILTTQSTASASELIINGLKPYITIVQIGDTTTGKNVGSITLYDSPTFTKKDINTSHHYAMQPLVLKTLNRDGSSDYAKGFKPDFERKENLANLGILGDPSEMYLNIAIAQITGNGKHFPQNQGQIFDEFKNSKSMNPVGTDMYVSKIPEGLIK
ncbi:peptidase S41 [Flavobacterium noncentrifugens]|nr:peptidase S41 [Flavobacterium noncentrifugens]